MILAGRLLFLVMMAGAVVVAVVAGAGRGAAPVRPGLADAYRCPMHPAISSPAAGECPLCRMPLVPGNHADVTSPEGATLTLTAAVMSAYGVQVARPKRLIVPRATVVPASLTAAGAGTALLYHDDLELLEVEEPAVFVPGEVPVRLLRSSATTWDAATVTVQFSRVDRAHAPPARPATGWVELRPRNRDALLVPAGAVLASASGPFVLVVVDERETLRTFAKRPVQIGRVVFGHATVRGGLAETDRVVIGSAFFVDAERRLASQSPSAEAPAR